MCSLNRSLNTTFNDNVDVIPFTGIMFEVTAISQPLNILTFELDMRLENASDLSVEVYSRRGYFADVFNQPDEWRMIASTEVIPIYGGVGAIIPVHDFAPVHIEANQRQSFYITAKQSILDHNVDALQKTGEVQMRNEDLQLFVGAGLTEYKFPSGLARFNSPMFAGIIHYEKENACANNPTITTTLTIPFLFEVSPSRMLDVTQSISETVNRLLVDDQLLKEYVSRFGLREVGSAATVAVKHQGACPDEWNDCPTSYLQTSIQFEHNLDLSPGMVLYEFYRSTEAIIKSVQRKTAGVNSIYVGLTSVAAKYELSLNGVPSGEEMDTIQQNYLIDTIERRLANEISSFGTIYNIEIQKQEVGNLKNLRWLEELDSTGTNSIHGIVRGALYSTLQTKEFPFAIDAAVAKSDQVLIAMLSLGSILPGPINEGRRYIYFQNITSVSSLTTSYIEPIEAGTKSSSNVILPIVGGILASLALVIGLWFLRRYHKDRKAHAMEVDEYREQRRQERRDDKLERLASKESLDNAMPPMAIVSTDSSSMGSDGKDGPTEIVTASPAPMIPSSTGISPKRPDSKSQPRQPDYQSTVSLPNGTKTAANHARSIEGNSQRSIIRSKSAEYPPSRPAKLDNFIEEPLQNYAAIHSNITNDTISLPAAINNTTEPTATLLSGARKLHNHNRSKEVEDGRSLRRANSSISTSSPRRGVRPSASTSALPTPQVRGAPPRSPSKKVKRAVSTKPTPKQSDPRQLQSQQRELVTSPRATADTPQLPPSPTRKVGRCMSAQELRSGQPQMKVTSQSPRTAVRKVNSIKSSSTPTQKL